MNYKDEIKRTVNTDIFKHEIKEIERLELLCETYKGIIKEDLKQGFIALSSDLKQKLSLASDFYTKDMILYELDNELKELHEEYKVLLEKYKKMKNRTLIKRILNL